jgi:MFS family permease
VLSGVSISSFTPNRIGEYFGRVYILDKASHVEGILITILGSMSQLLVTIISGTIALILFIPGFLIEYTAPLSYLYQGIILLAVVFDVLLLLFYFNVPILATLRDKLLKGKQMEKIRRFFEVFSKFSFRDLCRVIMLSFFRYLVFTGQYYLLLKIFSVPVPFFEAIVMISLIFLVISVIPTIFLTELGVRDSVAIFLFGIYFSRTGMMNDEIRMGILTASTVLWLINLAFPAMLGTFFVLRLKFFRRNGNGFNHS